MSDTNTELSARDDLVNLLLTAEGVTKVYPFEPNKIASGNVTVLATGGTDTEFNFEVRGYISGADAETSYAKLMNLREALEDVLNGQATYGPSQYDYQRVPAIDALVVRFQLTCGREDIL